MKQTLLNNSKPLTLEGQELAQLLVPVRQGERLAEQVDYLKSSLKTSLEILFNQRYGRFSNISLHNWLEFLSFN